jgi:hypothetical protein
MPDCVLLIPDKELALSANVGRRDNGGCPALANFTCSLQKNFLSKGAQMARRPQPPWWWRTEVLALMATALSVAVTTTYLVRLLTPYL